MHQKFKEPANPQFQTMINLIVTFLWSQCGIDLIMIVTNAMWNISLPNYKQGSRYSRDPRRPRYPKNC